MAKAALKVDTGIAVEHKNKFLRFTPYISAGNLVTALSIIVVGTVAWTQLRMEVGRLTTENDARKLEILATIAKQDADRSSLYKKIEDDHNETMANIQSSQKTNHDDIREIAASIGSRFDRLDDKLDRKVDKK